MGATNGRETKRQRKINYKKEREREKDQRRLKEREKTERKSLYTYSLSQNVYCYKYINKKYLKLVQELVAAAGMHHSQWVLLCTVEHILK